MTNFDKYKKLKSQFNYIHKGIYLNRVLSLQLWILANSKCSSFSLRSIIKIFLAKDINKLSFRPNIHTILTTFGDESRREYIKLYNNIITKIGNIASINYMAQIGHRITFSLNSFACLVKSFALLKNTDLTFKQKCQLAVNTAYYCNTIDLLERRSLSPNKYLCMCHVLGIDNLLTQYFKLKNIPTYSLQEGIYFLFGDNPPLDSILYENFETDHLLCWGKYTADEYNKYGIENHRLNVAGFPKDFYSSEIIIKKPLKKCLVLLARESFNTANIKLIELLSKFSNIYDFHLKLHPTCDVALFHKLAERNNMWLVDPNKTINDCLKNKGFDFSIAINTTAYYEILMNGIPCLRFHDETFVLMTGLYDFFTNESQFESQISLLQTIPEHQYQDNVNQLLEYAIGLGIDNYMDMIK